jgi:hypothetical protein
MKRFIIEQSDDEFYSYTSCTALVGLALNRFSLLFRKAKPVMCDPILCLCSELLSPGNMPEQRKDSESPLDF